MASISLRHKSHHLTLKSHHTLFNSSRLFSSSSSNNNDNGGDNDGNPPPKPSSYSSYFSQTKPTSTSASQPQSFDEIRKNLSQFRRLTSPNHPNSNPNPSSNTNANTNFKGVSLSLEKIRESLRNIGDKKVNNNENQQQFSLHNYKESLTMKRQPTANTSRVIGGSMDSLPKGTFGKEIREKNEKKSDADDESKFNLIKLYSHAELGKELKELRPDLSSKNKNKNKKEGEEEGWFSMTELQERLGKLREIEEAREREKSALKMGNAEFADLRKSMETIRLSKDEHRKAGKLDIMSQPGFMLSTPGTPKEHLIEKYFHPDNMSAAEKLKIELKKVRDEFKMSESDCGSTRVQIAQLTTEIHHLSSVLHKKDKHSRRGLQAKVQQRKKLLKYLRRTDWDSYCFVLSKLGLRDNPDYKN